MSLGFSYSLRGAGEGGGGKNRVEGNFYLRKNGG